MEDVKKEPAGTTGLCPFSADYVTTNANLKSPLEAEIPDQVAIDVQNVLDLADRLDLNKSQGQVGLPPRVIQEFQNEFMGLLIKKQLSFTFTVPATPLTIAAELKSVWLLFSGHKLERVCKI